MDDLLSQDEISALLAGGDVGGDVGSSLSSQDSAFLDKVAEIFRIHGIKTEIIAASIRHPMHVTECALAGADIATVPYKVIEQMTRHPLTDQGIEKFRKDYEAVFGK